MSGALSTGVSVLQVLSSRPKDMCESEMKSSSSNSWDVSNGG